MVDVFSCYKIASEVLFHHKDVFEHVVSPSRSSRVPRNSNKHVSFFVYSSSTSPVGISFTVEWDGTDLTEESRTNFSSSAGTDRV